MITLYEHATHILLTGKSEALNKLSELFQYQPNGFFYAPSYERFRASGGREGWDGFNRPLQRLTDTSGRILRGYRTRLLDEIEDRGYKVNTEKLLTSPFVGLTEDDVAPDIICAPWDLDEFQRRCIADWLVEGIGVNNVTVSGGKTAMFAGAAKLIKDRFPNARFLYLTPSERLVRQVTKEMRKFLPDFDVGQMGGGSHQSEAKDMVVCTVAMLSKHYHRLKSSKWFNSFIAVLYDEVHHAGSASSMKVVLEVPAFFRLGASDSTKEDDPTRNNAIHGLFGPVLNVVAAEPLIQRGRIAVPHIYILDDPAWNNCLQNVPFSPLLNSRGFVLLEGVWTDAVYKGQVFERDENDKIKTRSVKTAEWDEAAQDWKRINEPIIIAGLHRMEVNGEVMEFDSRWCLLDRMYDRCIIQFSERNKAIINWAKHFHQREFSTVVVCTRTLHIYILEALIQKVIDPDYVRILFGWSTPKERDETFEWFTGTPGAIMITPLVKEGVNLPCIRGMIVADWISGHEVANQIIGRAIRQKSESVNRAEIVWFRDRQHPILRSGCNRMFKRLQMIRGYEFYDPAPLKPCELELMETSILLQQKLF